MNPMPMPNDFLALSREKWRELPAGGETMPRTFSSELLALGDSDLLARWQAMATAAGAAEVRGWFHHLYADTFAGRRVVEVGCGFGFDGIHFLTCGAFWTFSDLVPENLALVRRLVGLLGLSARADYLLVENERSYAGLGNDPFDAVWAIGSLHHVPFDIARTESLDLMRHLRKGGRWIELTYPYERWQREGSLPFAEFGKRTDGERTPWAEWYDLAKMKQRLFPSRATTILDFTTGGGNFGWIDLRVDEPSTDPVQSRVVDLMCFPAEARNQASLKAGPGEWRLVCPPQIWWYSMTIDLQAATGALGAASVAGLDYAADLEVEVDAGSVGFLLAADNIDTFLGREQLIDARPSPRRVTVTGSNGLRPRYLLVRNAAAGIASRLRLKSATLRFTV
jgi:SAM-dependent methyltransferase